eukprot:GHVR01149700.1.p1 GENE.GHVR01149700.1~~GHVR01149700.1.p1  ORF type:complete len:107 (+),score=7.79 GHVR01149700.1:183-503(+)
MTLNAFYKNFFFIMIQFLYNFYNGGSGFPIYNVIFMNYYNLFYTSLFPFSIALFDKDEEIFARTTENNNRTTDDNSLGLNNVEVDEMEFNRNVTSYGKASPILIKE